MRHGRLALAGVVVAVLVQGGGGHAVAGGPSSWRVSRLPVGTSYAEPGVAAGAGGALVENACTANSNVPSTFWRSRDFGRTWTRGFPVGSSAIGCGDSDAAVGVDGYEYALTLGTGVDVYRSRDGRAWQGPASFPPPHGTDQPDRPWLVLVPHHPDEVLVFNSEVGGNIVMWRSDDHAATFTGPTLVTGGLNSQAVLALGSRPLADAGRLTLLYETAGAAGVDGASQFPLTQLWQAASNDGGRTWTNTEVLDVTSAFGVSQGSLGHLLPAAAVDRAGNVFAVLSVRLGAGTATQLYLLHRPRDGAWSAPSRIASTTRSNVYPAVAAGRRGRLFVSWYASAAASFDDPKARWTERVATTADALATHPVFVMVQLGGLVHAGAIESAGAIGSDLGEDWSLRDFQSVVVDSCGHPHVTWAADYPTARTFAATTTPYC